MILNNAGRRSFDGVILDDNGKPMPAADSLHHMIMEYAKVVNGGTSDIVTTSREVLAPYVPKVPCPVCGAEALHKMDILERVQIMPPNALRRSHTSVVFGGTVTTGENDGMAKDVPEFSHGDGGQL